VQLINNCNADLQLSGHQSSIPPGGVVDISCARLSGDSRIRNMVLAGHMILDCADPDCPAAKALLGMLEKKDSMLDSKGREIANAVLRGQMMDYSGYAKVNRNFAKAAEIAGLDILVDPVDDKHPKLIGNELSSFSKFKQWKGRCHTTIDSVVPNMSLAKVSRKRILYTTVETSTLPLSLRESFHAYDQVWTTSKFCSNVIRQEAGVDSHVLPGMVDERIWTHGGDIKQFSPQLRKFVFVSVFNWNYRKAPEILLHSYFRHFNYEDDVTLLLIAKFKRQASNARGVHDEVQQIAAGYTGRKLPHVARFSKEIDDQELASIYRASSCFVLPSRGEGYGLPHIESLLCGVPVVATNYGGYTDVLDHTNSTLVEYDSFKKVPNGSTGVSYWDGQMMLDLTSDSFIDSFGLSMRAVYDDYHKHKQRAVQSRGAVIAKVGSAAIASRIKNLMEGLK